MTIVSDVRLGRIDSVSHRCGLRRPCVHLLSPLPRAVLLARGPVERLRLHPVVCPEPCPVLASRAGDVLTLAFDRTGPIGRCKPDRIRHRWTFKLHDAGPDHVLAIREEF